jgi:hypothetical protein
MAIVSAVAQVPEHDVSNGRQGSLGLTAERSAAMGRKLPSSHFVYLNY